MALKIIVNAVLMILLATAQAAFLSGLPAPADNLNLLLVVLLFVLAFLGLNYALWWAAGAGLVMEIFSFQPFGVYLISLVLAAAAANFLLNYFFTNRSLYSFLALSGLATLIYQLIANLLVLMLTPAGEAAPWALAGFWLAGLEQLGLNLISTALIFYLVYFLGRNLSPVFLIKERKR